jgi:hypothetical protein
MSAELYKTFELCCETFCSTLINTIKNEHELIIFIQDIDNQLTKHGKCYDSNLNVFNFFINKISRNSVIKTSSKVWKKQSNELINIIGNVLKNATDIQLKFSIITILGLTLKNEIKEHKYYDPTICILVETLFLLKPKYSLFKNALIPYISNTTLDYLKISMELLFKNSSDSSDDDTEY